MEYFSNKTAVITGAANGLGKAMAVELSKQKCNLALIDIDIEGLARLKAELERNDLKLSVHHTDISNEAEVKLAMENILAIHNKVEILVNNAAISSSRPFTQVAMADYHKIMDVNFWGTVYCTRHFLPALQQQSDTRLVNVISYFAWTGFKGKTTYGSSKSAVMGFTNALFAELHGTTVKVSLVIPPPMPTGLVKGGTHIDETKLDAEIKFIKDKGMAVEKAAGIILRGVKKGRYKIIVGATMSFIDLGSRLFPTWMQKVLARKKFDFT